MARVRIQTTFLLELDADEIAVIHAALEGTLPPAEAASARSIANEILRQRLAAHVAEIRTMLTGTKRPQLQADGRELKQAGQGADIDVIVLEPESENGEG